MAKKSKRSKPEQVTAVARGDSGTAWFLDPARLPPAVLLGVVLALHLLLMWSVFNPTIFTGGDNGVYVALSRSLLERGEYVSIHDPTQSPHTLYPPGYPAILALGSLVGFTPWVPLKVLGALFAAAGVAFSFLWARRHATPGIALFAAVLVAMSPGLLSQGQNELSDVPFFALAMVVLWALERLPREDVKRTALAGAFMAAAYLVRTAGIPLVVAALAWLAWERRWKQLGIFAALVVPAVVGWSLWTNAQAAADLTYGAYANVFWLKEQYDPSLGEATLFDVFLRIFANGHRYASVMIPLLLTGRAGGALTLLGYGLIVLATVGWARRVRKPGAVELFFPLYAGMIAVLPTAWAGERYLLPIWPVALAYAAQVVCVPMAAWQPRARALVGAAAVGAVFLVAAQPLAASAQVGSFCRDQLARGERYGCLSPAWQDYLGMADWANAELPEDAVIISRKPGLFFALSDRMGVDIPKTADPEEYFRTAQAAGADYLILDQIDFLSTQYSVPVVQAYPSSFCLRTLGEVPGSIVLGIRYGAPREHAASPQDRIVFQDCPERARERLEAP
jgi:hypothetical protein